MLEITSDDIASLADGDLRDLIALLCEAELRKRKLSASAVTAGGAQDAADGGIDVRIALPAATQIEGFIPRPSTGYQAKKPDMPRNAILAEMRPRGVIRPVIQDLADKSGAYIIVSATASTSDSALNERKQAMAEAIVKIRNADQLLLDFYDRTRLATWVRDHSGLVPWVRQKVGRAIPGWHPYEAWAYDPNGVAAEYLIDETVRFRGASKDEDGVSVAQGLQRLRELLSQPRKIARLAGLSGVGKTRFVQALFDDRVGEASLPQSMAIYTDMGEGPMPPPIGMASDLIAARTRAILVVDNCPQDLHQRLSEVCRTPDSELSLVTIEYDIREDEPEGTEVFRLAGSSTDLIEGLVKIRFPAVSEVDTRTIADFSDGNARIAFALADTLGKNESLASLSDDALFLRLFYQRNAADESLLFAAQACSLVYSFEGESLSGDSAELPQLAGLIGISAEQLFRGVAALTRRGLVQKRSVWRAVLPPAIANRLAALALQNISSTAIQDRLVSTSERLLRSFSRRLGYLHDCAEAVQIVERWLQADGLLGNVTELNDLGRAMLKNAAPVSPEALLVAFERGADGPKGVNFFAEDNWQRGDFIELLRLVAYDAKLFDRCVHLLIAFAVQDKRENQHNGATGTLSSLFHLYVSATHASIEQRVKIVEALLLSSEPKKQTLGLAALGALLEAWHFGTVHSFDFGARPRNYGLSPATRVEEEQWFSSAIRLVEGLAVSDYPIAIQVGLVLAQKFRGLWTRMEMFEDLERASRSISNHHYWKEGWISVRETLRFDHKSDDYSDGATRLRALEKFLAPASLAQEIRAVVLTSSWTDDLTDDVDDASEERLTGAFERNAALAEELGFTAAEENAVLDELLPELFVPGEGRQWFFGRGLAKGSKDPSAMWGFLTTQLNKKADERRSVQVLRGFVNGLREVNATFADNLLDAVIDDELLGQWLPILQSAIQVDQAGAARIKRSLIGGRAPISAFMNLAYGGVNNAVPSIELREIIHLIAAKEDGFEVALELLSMRLHSYDTQKKKPDADIVAAGQELLRGLQIRRDNGRQGYRLGKVARACLVGPEGADVAQTVCRILLREVEAHSVSTLDHDDLVKGLLSVQPLPVFDILFSDVGLKKYPTGIGLLHDTSRHHSNPLDIVSVADLLRWCEQKPDTGYIVIAEVISFCSRPTKEAPPQWTQQALAILERAPDPVAVLTQYVMRFRPRMWSGSRATIIEERTQLLLQLDDLSGPTVREFAAREYARLTTELLEERNAEARRDKNSDERFE